MKKTNGCLYQNIYNNTCTKKIPKRRSKDKHYCIHSNPSKCKLYVEWVKIKRKRAAEGLYDDSELPEVER